MLVFQVSGPETTVELNVTMHCEGCAEQLQKKILQMRGIYNLFILDFNIIVIICLFMFCIIILFALINVKTSIDYCRSSNSSGRV